jgi:hypothetical protein
MKLTTLLLAAALPLLAAGPALAAGSLASTTTTGAAAADATPAGSAADGLVTARDPQSIVDALSSAGYPGKIEKMDSGRTSIAVKISGLNTYIDFYDCADDLTDCYTLLFSVALDLKDGTTLDKANKWNSDQITGRVWLDDGKDPTLDYTVSTFDGFTPAVFEQNIKLWDKKIGDFKDFFDF